MITIKYSVTVSYDEPILPELRKNAKVNDWWVGGNEEQVMFSKTFNVERIEDVSVLQLRLLQRDMAS